MVYAVNLTPQDVTLNVAPVPAPDVVVDIGLVGNTVYVPPLLDVKVAIAEPDKVATVKVTGVLNVPPVKVIVSPIA